MDASANALNRFEVYTRCRELHAMGLKFLSYRVCAAVTGLYIDDDRQLIGSATPERTPW